MNPERRRLPRKTPAEFNFIRIEQEYIGRVLNFSEEGLCFETMSPIGDQDLVQFLFSVHLLDGIEGFGNIVWINATRNVGGIKIAHLSRTSRQKIHGLINEVPTKEAVTTGTEPARESDSGPVASERKPELGEASESTVPHVTKADAALEVNGATVEIKARGPERLEVEQPAKVFAGASLATGETAETKIASTGGVVPPTGPVPAKVPRWPTPAAAKPSLPTAGTPLPFHQADLMAAESTAEREAATLPMESMKDPARPEPHTLEPRELIPLKRHLAVQKSQFIRGALLGIGACFLVGLAVLKFSKPLAPSVSAEVAPTPTSTGSAMGEPGSNPAVTLTSIGQTTSALTTSRKSRDTGHSSAAQSNKKAPGAVEQFSGSSKIISYSAEATTSEQPVPSTTQDTASPAPTVAPGNAVPAVRSGPLFETFNKITVPTDAFRSPSQTSSGAKDAPSGGDSDSESGIPAFHRRGSIFSPTAGGVVRPARLVQSSPPSYPAEARKMGLSGEVVIDAIVNASGTLNSIQVVSGPDLLRPAALQAVAQWRYQPALLDGKPTTEHVTIILRFRAK
jgi:TonB family protein